MSLDLTRRAEKGSALTAAEHDQNLTNLEAAAFPASVLVVRALADLPAPAGGVITLPANTTVLVFGQVSLGANAIAYSEGTVLRGIAGGSLISSSTGGVVRANNVDSAVIMREISIIATAGPCLALTGTDEHQLNLFFVGLFGAAIGTISGFDVQSFKDCFFSCADGIILTGTPNKIFLSQCPFYGITAGNAAITLAAELDARRLDMVQCFFKHAAAGVPLRAVAGYTVGYGRVSGTMMDGPTAMLEGISPADINWWFRENDLVQNSRVAGQSFLTDPATTVITTQGVFVPVTGPFTVTELTQRLVLNGTNELEYIGVDPVLISFNAAFSVDPSNNNQLAFRASKNGVTLERSETIVEQGAGPGSSPRTGAVVCLIEMMPGDRVGLSVANLSSTADVPWLAATYAVVAG